MNISGCKCLQPLPAAFPFPGRQRWAVSGARLQRSIRAGPSWARKQPRSGSACPALDDALQGGLAFGALHELAPASELQLGAAFGFGLAIAALAAAGGRSALCIQTDFAALEAGTPYGPGLDLLGLPMDRLLILRVARPLDVLWAFEEALKCPALAAVLAELPETGAAADLTATRRLSLAARAGGGLGLLLRHRPCPLATAAMTRWQVAAA